MIFEYVNVIRNKQVFKNRKKITLEQNNEKIFFLKNEIV